MSKKRPLQSLAQSGLPRIQPG